MRHKEAKKITKCEVRSTKKERTKFSKLQTSRQGPASPAKRGERSSPEAESFRLQRGVAIYLALIILSVILAIGMGMSAILIGQMKITKGMENSVVALYAADSGIERILYEEKICRQSDCDPIRCEGWPPEVCLGLKEGYTATSTDLMGGDASYIAGLKYFDDGGVKKIKFTSIGEYKGVKRAIESTVLLPPPPEFAVWRGACESDVSFGS